MPSDGLGRSGQQYDPKWGVVIRFVKKVLDYTVTDGTRVTGNEGNANTEINPMDSAAAEETLYDTSAIAAVLDAKVISFPGRTSTGELNIPPLLTSIEVTYNFQSGNGENLHPASQQYFIAVGTSGSGSYNPKATAEASASIIPDLVFNYREIWNNKVPVTHYMLFMADNYTEAQLITRLNTILSPSTVTSWPTFKPEAHSFTVKGMSVNLQQSADSRAFASFSGDDGSMGSEYGSGYSSSVGLTVKTVNLPAMLHGAISIAGYSATGTATVDVEASTRQIDSTGTVTITLPAVTNNPSPITATATGSVYPYALAATSPATFPTSGLYLYDISNDPFGYGRVLVRASVVNAAQFA